MSMDERTTQNVPSESRRHEGDPTRIARHVENIVSVTQIKGSFELHTAQVEAPLVPLDFLGEATAGVRDKVVVVHAKYEFRAVQKSERADDLLEREPVFSARCEFMVVYELDSQLPSVSDADLSAFAQINGRLNSIPYWREFLHNSLVRASLPAYEVPPFNPLKMMSRRPTGGAASDDGANAKSGD